MEDEGATSTFVQDRFMGMLIDDRYKIESRLGQGGMGVVYAARHIMIDKPVAIKILRHEYCQNESLTQRFMREAQAASRIGHPNIVDVTDFGKLEDGHIYFVMEYLSGVTLSDELKQVGGSLPTSRVLDLSVQICQALGAAHAKGIVHRDLKPENIFIINPSNDTQLNAQDGHRHDFVKLLDFGIAKISWDTSTRLTKVGSIFGTPQYMSPEQASGKDCDFRGDIYSMGCIIYEMCTGEVPFTADTFMGTLTKHMFEKPVPPRELRPDLGIPPGVERVILRALAKEAEDRFNSMAEMAASVVACDSVEIAQQEGSDFATPVLAEPKDAGGDQGVNREVILYDEDPLSEDGLGRESKPSTSRTGLWVTFAVTIILGALAGGYFLWRSQNQIVPSIDAGGTIAAADLGMKEDATLAANTNVDAGVKPVPKADAAVKLVHVILDTKPAGAEVFDGRYKLLGTTPFTAQLIPGQKIFYIFRSPGYEQFVTKPLDVPNRDKIFKFRLRRRRRPVRGDNVNSGEAKHRFCLRNPFTGKKVCP